jgi:hypothetical protein
MTPQKFDWHSGLISLVLEKIGWSAGMAILLASSNALAFSNNPIAASSPTQLPGDTALAKDVEGQTSPQESQPDKPDTQTSNQSRFSCQFLNGQYTVMYSPQSQPGQSYAWATPTALGGGWTPERRCNEISRRLEFYRPDGLLEMRTAVENNYNTVCVTTQKNPACQIVLTVPPGQDPQSTRDRVFQNISVADSGKETQAVNTFTGGDSGYQMLDRVLNQGLSAIGIGNNSSRRSSNINLRPFLDPADGGTGTQLQRGIPARPNPRLNPDRFR